MKMQWYQGKWSTRTRNDQKTLVDNFDKLTFGELNIHPSIYVMIS